MVGQRAGHEVQPREAGEARGAGLVQQHAVGGRWRVAALDLHVDAHARSGPRRREQPCTDGARGIAGADEYSACTGGAPRQPRLWSAATPRWISARALATSPAASSMEGRSRRSVQGRADGRVEVARLRRGGAAVGAQGSVEAERQRAGDRLATDGIGLVPGQHQGLDVIAEVIGDLGREQPELGGAEVLARRQHHAHHL